jgi:hypothetical protein
MSQPLQVEAKWRVMNNHRAKRVNWNPPGLLDKFPFLDNRAKICGEVVERFQDIPSSIKLSCHKKDHRGCPPHERLAQDSNGKIYYFKVCDKHRKIVRTTSEIDTSGNIEVEGFEPSIKRMERNARRNKMHFVTRKPKSP